MFKELLLERNANRVVDGKKVKFEASDLRDLREIMDWVSNNEVLGNKNFKLIERQGDWELTFDISNGKELYKKMKQSYDFSKFDVTEKGNTVTIKAIPKETKK